MRRSLLLALLIAACRPVPAPTPCESATDCPDGWICQVPAHECEAPPDLTRPAAADLAAPEFGDLRPAPADLTTACTSSATCKVGQACCGGSCVSLADAQNCGGCGIRCSAPAALCCPAGDMGHVCTDVLVGCK